MRLFDDMIVLELQREEWEIESKRSPIFLPDSVRDKQEGNLQEKIPYHFFMVVQVGPKVKNVEVGDRIIPKPPTPEHPPIQPVIIWRDGKKEAIYITYEKCVAGVE